MKNPFEDLLVEYSKTPKRPPPDPSFMEIAGYPHFENVCSNIIAFFIDPNREHGLQCTVLKALCKLRNDIPKEILEESNTLKVYREHPSPNGGRIDIVVETDNHLLLIENKIYHWLANDLEDYATISESFPKRKTSARIVLSLSQIGPTRDLDGGFRNILHKELWNEALSILPTTSPKWEVHLKDFIQTMNSLSTQDFTLSDEDRFYIDNENSIRSLIKSYNAFESKLSNQVARLRSILEDQLQKHPISIAPKLSIWQGTCLAMELNIISNDTKHTIIIDTWLDGRGWLLSITTRNRASESFLSSHAAKHNFRFEKKQNEQVRVHCSEHDLTTHPSLIANEMRNLATKISN